MAQAIIAKIFLSCLHPTNAPAWDEVVTSGSATLARHTTPFGKACILTEAAAAGSAPGVDSKELLSFGSGQIVTCDH